MYHSIKKGLIFLVAFMTEQEGFMKLGAQLYTLRDFTQTEADLADSLKKIADIGYTEVQISAIGPIAPEKVKELCDENSLKIVLTHTNPERIMNDTDAVIKEHEIMGCDYIGIGSMPGKYKSEAWYDHFRKDYIEAAKKIAASGKLLMYHNHNFEFGKIDGKRIIERILDDFKSDELGITLDTYWLQAAGGDCLEWIEILKDRLPCVHLKDMEMYNGQAIMAPVLEGNMNFKSILGALDNNGVTKHILVEQDTCRESPFICLKKSYDNVAKLGYK